MVRLHREDSQKISRKNIKIQGEGVRFKESGRILL